jgi:hypothetical protein
MGVRVSRLTLSNKVVVALVCLLGSNASFNSCSKVGFTNAQNQSTEGKLGCKGATGSVGIVDPECLDPDNPNHPKDPHPPTDPPATPGDPPTPIPTRDVRQTFTVTAAGRKVDILLVIDNSGSMDEDINKLAQRLDGFVARLDSEKIDWQLCLTTTDPGLGGAALMWSGTSDYVLTKNIPNRYQVFTNTINNLGSGSGSEQGIAAMRGSLNDNRGCYRQDALLAPIVISDEDERSTGGYPSMVGQPQYEPLTDVNLPASYVSAVRAKFGASKKVSVSTIVINPGDTACFDTQRAESLVFYGARYTELRKMTGGIKGNICASDYANQLRDIGDGIKASLSSLQLECAPVGRPYLTILPNPPAGLRAELMGDKIYFNPALQEGSSGIVEYKCRL